MYKYHNYITFALQITHKIACFSYSMRAQDLELVLEQFELE